MRRRVSDYKYDENGNMIPFSAEGCLPPVTVSDIEEETGQEGKLISYNIDITRKHVPPVENTSETGHRWDKSGTTEGHFSYDGSWIEEGSVEHVDGFSGILVDTFFRENRQAWSAREVRDELGVREQRQKEAFRKYLQRRVKSGFLRVTAGGRYQFCNNDWKASKITTKKENLPSLGLNLPFGMDFYIKTLPRTTMVVAGEVGSGKTHYALELAQLNLGKIPIRFFFAESGTYRMQDYLDDYPEIAEAIDRDDGTIDVVNTDIDNVDVLSSLDPDGLNIHDYLRMQTGDLWWLQMQMELREYATRLETGMLVVNLQKLDGAKYAMGGQGTTFQNDIGVNLNVIEKVQGSFDEHGYKLCRLDIVKARDWAGKVNPEVMSVDYRTAGIRGKLKMIPQSWDMTSKKKKRDSKVER